MSDASNQALRTLTELLTSTMLKKPEPQDLSKMVPDISNVTGEGLKQGPRRPCPNCGEYHGEYK
jgi:hypothetical protein